MEQPKKKRGRPPKQKKEEEKDNKIPQITDEEKLLKKELKTIIEPKWIYNIEFIIDKINNSQDSYNKKIKDAKIELDYLNDLYGLYLEKLQNSKRKDTKVKWNKLIDYHKNRIDKINKLIDELKEKLKALPITPKPITPKPKTPKPITPKPKTPKPITPKPKTPKEPKPKTPKEPKEPKPKTPKEPKPKTPKEPKPKAPKEPKPKIQKECPEGKIINPATGRCVLITSAIGKKLNKKDNYKIGTEISQLREKVKAQMEELRNRPEPYIPIVEQPEEQPQEPPVNIDPLEDSLITLEQRFNNYNKIIDYLNIINIEEIECLRDNNHEYILTDNLLLHKQIGSQSVAGLVFITRNINFQYKNIPDMALKIQGTKTNKLDGIKLKKILNEIKIFKLVSNYALINKIPHLPLFYKDMLCTKDFKGNKADVSNLVKGQKGIYSLFLSELADGDIKSGVFNNWEQLLIDDMILNILSQILISILALLSLGLNHTDCHLGNFLYTKIKSGGCFHYNINGKNIYIENKGYLITITDFGLTRPVKKDTYGEHIRQIINDCSRPYGIIKAYPKDYKINALNYTKISTITKIFERMYKDINKHMQMKIEELIKDILLFTGSIYSDKPIGEIISSNNLEITDDIFKIKYNDLLK